MKAEAQLRQEFTDVLLDKLINEETRNASQAVFIDEPIVDEIYLTRKKHVHDTRVFMSDVALRSFGLNYQSWNDKNNTLEVGVCFPKFKSFMEHFTHKGVEVFKMYLDMQARKHGGIIQKVVWAAFMNNTENLAYAQQNPSLFVFMSDGVRYFPTLNEVKSSSSFGDELRHHTANSLAEKKKCNVELRAKWLEEFKSACLTLSKDGKRCTWRYVLEYANVEYMRRVADELGLECEEQNGGVLFSWYSKEEYERLCDGLLF